MKRLCSLFAITVLAAACNRAEAPPPAPAAPAAKPYANLAQVMQAIPFPASNIIFDAQSSDPGAPPKPADSADGTGSATQTYANVYGGWTAVENAALALQETANLITIPGRMCQNGKPVPLDQDDFKKWAANLAAAGDAALKAAKAKNLDQMVDVAGTVSEACAMCHEKYRDVDDLKNRCTP